MNLKQALKITLLTMLLVIKVRNVISSFKIGKCNSCSKVKLSYQLLHDDSLTICDNCASHFNDMSNDN